MPPINLVPPVEDASHPRGVIDSIKGFFANALGTTRDRVEDLTAEAQHRAQKVVHLVIWSVAGALSLWFALCFAVLTIIFGFGLPPKYAYGIPAALFTGVGLLSIVVVRRVKRSRRRKPRPAR